MSGTDGYRYPGPNEFEDTPADHLLFSGRDAEINAITQQIISSRLLVLYGSSGLGKSSLLKAGVYPKLRENNFCPVRVRITDKMGVLQLLAQSCAETGREANLDYTPGVGSTPWEFFKTAMFWRGETLLYPVLIFDQFEELFTTVAPSWKSYFANEIGPLASGNLPASVRQRLEQGEKGLTDLPPQVKLIFSLREEFYGSLEELSTDFPALFQDRFRLLPMDRSRAEDAIRLPARKESEGAITFNTDPFEYADETVRLMLGFLAGRHGTIEPFQLQLLCQHVERAIVPGKLRTGASSEIEITPSDLGGEQVMSDLVRRFYTESLALLPRGQQRRARELCETGRLSSDGHRLMLEKNEILDNYKISEDTLKHLVDKRILREEPRLESLFYEIGHDTIAASILKTRRWRLPRKYARYVVAAGVVTPLVLLFIGYGIYKNYELRIESEHEKLATVNAQQAQGNAEKARTNAEKLASYLIGEDLMEAIKPIGRIDVLESVQKQIDDFLDKSSPEEKASDNRTIQIEGLSHLNHGDLDYEQAELTQASEEYGKALDAFQGLSRKDPNNPEWLHNIADAEAKLANVLADQFFLQKSLDWYQRALGHIQTALGTNPSSIDPKLREKLLRDKAETVLNIGEALYKQRHLDAALKAVKESNSLAGAQPQPTMQWTYIYVDGLLTEGRILESQGQDKAAQDVLRTALETAQKSAQMNPFDPEAQRDLGVAQNWLANFNMYRGDPEQVLAQYKSLNNIMQKAINWEPRNERWQRDFAYSFLLLADGYNYADRYQSFDKNKQLFQQAIQKFERIQKIDNSNANIISDIADSHRDWGALLANSEPDAAVSHYSEALNLLANLNKIDGTDTDPVFSSAYLLFDKADALRADQKPDAALEAGRQAFQLVNALGPVDRSDAEYWELSGLLHREMGDALQDKKDKKGAGLEFQASLNAIDQAVQRAPASPRYWNERYMVHMAIAQTSSDKQLKFEQDALEDAKKTVELDPGNASYNFSQGEAQSKLGDEFDAKEVLDIALKNYLDAEQSYRKAMALASKQDAKNYRDWLRNLLEVRLAPLYEKTQDKQGELRAYKEVVQIRQDEAQAAPTVAGNFSYLAAAQMKAGDELAENDKSVDAFNYYTDAEQSYRKAIATSDKAGADATRTYLFALLCKHVADLHIKQHDKQGALHAYEEAIQIRKDQITADPKNMAYRSGLASAYEEIGNDLRDSNLLEEANDYYALAVQSWNEEIALQPTAAAWDNLGGLYYNGLSGLREKQNNETATVDSYRKAVDAEKHAIALDTGTARYLSNIGYAYQAIGNSLVAQHDPANAAQEYNQSAQWFKKSALLKNDDPACWYGLTLTSEEMAHLHEETGDRTTARQDYDAALQAVIKAGELDPKDKKYSEERASIESKLKQLAVH